MVKITPYKWGKLRFLGEEVDETIGGAWQGPFLEKKNMKKPSTLEYLVIFDPLDLLTLILEKIPIGQKSIL